VKKIARQIRKYPSVKELDSSAPYHTLLSTVRRYCRWRVQVWI